MLRGITPYDFVRKVYYTQEKVILDLWPSDDKYKEVIMEANIVITEFQKDWDWSWKRERYILGSTNDPEGPGAVPAYVLPDWVYKPATFADDCVRLYHAGGCHKGMCCSCHDNCYRLDERSYIEVPYMPTSARHHKPSDHISVGGQHFEHKTLGANIWGNEIHFTRPLTHIEKNRIAVTDVIRRMEPLHICDHTCVDKDGNIPNYAADDYRPCTKIEPVIFEDVPDPDYFVIKTAARHCVGSPPAAFREQALQEDARSRLSAMRDNDQQYTEPDTVERDWDIRTVDAFGGYGYAYNYPTRGHAMWF